MKLLEIHHEDPLGMVLIRRLMAKGVPVFYQDMGEIRKIDWRLSPAPDKPSEQIIVMYGDGNRSDFDYMTVDQFDAMYLKRIEGSDIEEWQLI